MTHTTPTSLAPNRPTFDDSRKIPDSIGEMAALTLGSVGTHE